MNNPKFRLWDDKNKKWMLGYESSNLGGFSMFGECMLFGEYSKAIKDIDNWDNLILTQYSCQTDICNKEIFSGDIFSEKWKAEVFQNKDGAFMVRFHINPLVNKPMLLSKYLTSRKRAGTDDTDSFVIGNIFEHNELLTK